jgi:hypothetical protein
MWGPARARQQKFQFQSWLYIIMEGTNLYQYKNCKKPGALYDGNCHHGPYYGHFSQKIMFSY